MRTVRDVPVRGGRAQTVKKAEMHSGGSPMKYKVTVEVLKVEYHGEYDSDAGPREVLARIREAVEAKPTVP